MVWKDKLFVNLPLTGTLYYFGFNGDNLHGTFLPLSRSVFSQIRDLLAARSIDFVLTPDFAIVLNHFKIRALRYLFDL